MSANKSNSDRAYQYEKIELLTEEEIIQGLINGRSRSCYKQHAKYNDWNKGDICVYIEYPFRGQEFKGGYDHFNLTWILKWCKYSKPKVIEKYLKLKAFW